MGLYDRVLHRGLLLGEAVVAAVVLVFRACFTTVARVVRAVAAALVWVARWTVRRRTVAGAGMAGGIAAASYGSYLEWGAGVGLMVLAGLLIPLSLLIGWE